MLADDYVSSLFLSYHHDMLRLACLYLKNPSDAEDIVSDCWLSVLMHKDKIETMDATHVHTYLLRCVANASIDFLRKKKRQAAWLETAVQNAKVSIHIAPDDEAVDSIMIETLHQALPWREAEIFVLRMQGLSFPEIADQLGISPSTARSYWWRARRKLRHMIAVE